jgi:hypothetical protein
MLKCGFYEMKITPFLGCAMPGYFHRRSAKEVRDKLYVEALAAGDGKHTIAVASVDHLGLSGTAVRVIKERVQKLAGILPDHVLINCSHVHQGGHDAGGNESVWNHVQNYFQRQGKSGSGDEYGEDEQYLQFLINRVADTIVLAAQRMEPSELRFGKGSLEGQTFCRIYNMEGGGLQTNPFGMNTKSQVSQARRAVLGSYRKVDQSVNVIEVRQKGRTTGIVVNFTTHPDMVGSDTAISADYPGELRRVLKEHYGKDVTVSFLQGPCGDINHVDAFHYNETHYPTRYLELGRALAVETMNVLDRAEPSKSEDVLAAGHDLSLSPRKPGKDLLAWSEKTIAETAPDLNALTDFDPEQVDLFFAHYFKTAHERENTSLSAYVQVLKLGDLGIYASPGELFSAYGDELRKKSPFERTLVAAYSNGYLGYIVTPDCYAEGVYEARQTVLDPPAGGIMNEELLRLGEEVYKGRPSQ